MFVACFVGGSGVPSARGVPCTAVRGSFVLRVFPAMRSGPPLATTTVALLAARTLSSLQNRQDSGDRLNEASGKAKHPDAALIARGLHSLVRQRNCNRAAWNAHLERALLAVERADAEGTSRVLNACARSPVEAEHVARVYLERALKLLPQANARQLSMVANSAARIRFRDEVLFLALARELRAKFCKCNILEASVLANAFARLLIVDRVLFGQLLPSFVDSHAAKFRVKDLSQVMNAYAKMQLRSESVFLALSERSLQQAQHMDGHAISVVASAHAKLSIANRRLFEAFANRLRTCAVTCTLQGVSNILNAFARLVTSFDSVAFVAQVEAHGGVGGKGISSDSAVPTISLVEGVFDCVLAELPRFRSEMTAQSVCVMAQATARLRQHLRLPELAPVLAAEVMEVGMATMDLSQIAMLSVAFAEMWPLPPCTPTGVGNWENNVPSMQRSFWTALSAVATSEATSAHRRGTGCDSFADTANCALAFAAARLGADSVAAFGLASRSGDELSPQIVSALLCAHALARLHDRVLFETLWSHIPGILWQASDVVTCRLALAMWVTMGFVDASLVDATLTAIIRISEKSEVVLPSRLPERAGLLAASQGFVAVTVNALAAQTPSTFELDLEMSSRHPEVLALKHHSATPCDSKRIVRIKAQSWAKVEGIGERLGGWLEHAHSTSLSKLVRWLAQNVCRRMCGQGSGGEETLVAEGEVGTRSQAVVSLLNANACHEVQFQRPQTVSGNQILGNIRGCFGSGSGGGSVRFGAEAQARAPDLRQLLMPSVELPLSVSLCEDSRDLARLLLKCKLKSVLHHMAHSAPVAGDVAVLLPLNAPAEASSKDRFSWLPVAFLIDGVDALAREWSSQNGLGWGPVLPESNLRAMLLASDGYTVIRLSLSSLERLRGGSVSSIEEMLSRMVTFVEGQQITGKEC